MNDKRTTSILLLSDDTTFLGMLESEFPAAAGYQIETKAVGELFVEGSALQHDVILIEYPPGEHDVAAMNDNYFLGLVKGLATDIPVIMLLSHEQESNKMAIKSMLHKAVNFVVKDDTAFMQLKNIINRLLEYRKLEKQLHWYMDRM